MKNMLEAIGAASLDKLIAQTMPQSIRQRDPLDLGPALSEREALQKLRAIARKNKVLISLIGQGYYGTITAARDPAQRPGKSGLVHRLYAVSAGDQPGAAGGAC